MNANENFTKTLRSIIDIGARSYTIAAVFVFGVKKGKPGFIKELDILINKFTKSLSEQEREELQNDIDTMLEKKAEELVRELKTKLTEEETEQALESLRSSAQIIS